MMHDVNVGYRDALAMLTATNAQDDEARQLIMNDGCPGCIIDALASILLACIDEHWNGDVKAFAQTAFVALEL